jgi:hypothetical protein
LNYSEENHTLVIGKRSGTFENLIREREIQIFFMDKSVAKFFNLNRQPDKVIKYNGSSQAVSKL